MDIRFIVEYGLSFLTIFGTTFFLLVLLENRDQLVEKLPPKPKRFPKVSILIPAYNEEEAIFETIKSAVDANYPDKEIIVIDDGSTDKTLKIAKSFKGITVIHQKNAGKGAALNNGLRHAHGELIATLDADSFMDKQALMQLVGFFEDAKVGAVTSVMKVHEPKGILQKFQRLEYLVTVFNRRLLSFVNAINVTPGPMSMFRMKVFDEVGGYDEHNILEDQEIAMRIQAAQWKIESSMNAVVYTNVPKTLKELIAQRVRWHRGGIRNTLKHYYLVSPKYGDFGVFVMPISIVSVFALFIVLVFALTSFFRQVPGVTNYGLDAIIYTVTPLHVLFIAIFAATIIWAYLGVKSIKGENASPIELMGYVIVYAPLITLFWIITAVKEIKREKLRW